MRFMIGPWTDREVENHETIAAAFNELYPNVNFSFKLFSWGTAGTEVDASLADGAHDIYYFGEGGYMARAEQENGFEDITARINDPAWAEEKAKYLYWDRIEAYGPKLIGLPICLARRGRPVRQHGHGARGRVRRDIRRGLGHVRRVRHGDDERLGHLRTRHRHAARRLRRVVPARPRRRRQLPDGGPLRSRHQHPRRRPGHAAARRLLLRRASRRRRARSTTTRRRTPSSPAGWPPTPPI